MSQRHRCCLSTTQPAHRRNACRSATASSELSSASPDIESVKTVRALARGPRCSWRRARRRWKPSPRRLNRGESVVVVPSASCTRKGANRRPCCVLRRVGHGAPRTSLPHSTLWFHLFCDESIHIELSMRAVHAPQQAVRRKCLYPRIEAARCFATRCARVATLYAVT